MADPGFPRWGTANPKVGRAKLLFWVIFPENCMKITEEIGQRGSAGISPLPMFCGLLPL